MISMKSKVLNHKGGAPTQSSRSQRHSSEEDSLCSQLLQHLNSRTGDAMKRDAIVNSTIDLDSTDIEKYFTSWQILEEGVVEKQTLHVQSV